MRTRVKHDWSRYQRTPTRVRWGMYFRVSGDDAQQRSQNAKHRADEHGLNKVVFLLHDAAVRTAAKQRAQGDGEALHDAVDMTYGRVDGAANRIGRVLDAVHGATEHLIGAFEMGTGAVQDDGDRLISTLQLAFHHL